LRLFLQAGKRREEGMTMNNNNGSKFFDGFLWGAIIGGAVVYFLSTKGGKKILKALTEEGLGNLADLMEEGVEEYEEVGEEPSSAKATEDKEEAEPSGNGVTEEKTAKEEKPTIRKRFFRRKSS